MQRLSMDSACELRHLFVDLQDVQGMHHAVQAVTPATKHPHNPVMDVGSVLEWDAEHASPWAMRGVVYDPQDRLFKCWYNGKDTDHTGLVGGSGLAFSDDGVEWIKPKLGLIEYSGSKDNNLFWNYHWGVVILDEKEEDPSQRFKMYSAKGPAGVYNVPKEYSRAVYYSGDGINWRVGYGFNINGWTGWKIWDHVNFMRDDVDPDPERRYKLIWQSYEAPNKWGPPEVRIKCMAWSPGEADFTSNPHNPILSPNDSTEQENHFSMLFTYEGLYVLLYEYGWYMPDKQAKYGSYCGDVRMAISRDGRRFERVQPTQPVIPRGETGEWDEQFLVITNAPVIRDGKIYLYYSGQAREWADWPPLNGLAPYPNQIKRFDTGHMRLARMGLATLRLDGLASVQSADRGVPGHVTTKSIRLSRRDVEIRLNVDNGCQHRSFVLVEVLDAHEDRVLPGFDRFDCEPLHRDDLSAPVRWKSQTLRDLKVDEVRLRFWLCGPVRLFSYAFAGAKA